MPDNEFWLHINTYDPYSGKGIPTVNVWTSKLAFPAPCKARRSLISHYTYGTHEARRFLGRKHFDGARRKYPAGLPKGTTRWRKQTYESADDAKEGGKEEKKIKIGKWMTVSSVLGCKCKVSSHFFPWMTAIGAKTTENDDSDDKLDEEPEKAEE